MRLDLVLFLALLCLIVWVLLAFVAPLGAGWVHLLLPAGVLLLVRRVVAGRGRW